MYCKKNEIFKKNLKNTCNFINKMIRYVVLEYY